MRGSNTRAENSRNSLMAEGDPIRIIPHRGVDGDCGSLEVWFADRRQIGEVLLGLARLRWTSSPSPIKAYCWRNRLSSPGGRRQLFIAAIGRQANTGSKSLRLIRLQPRRRNVDVFSFAAVADHVVHVFEIPR